MRWLTGFARKVFSVANDSDREGLTQQEPTVSNSLRGPISNGSGEFDPDQPISPEYKKDRLGFRSVAHSLAHSLLTRATSHGLVVSIEGVWGSGKSSLVNLLAGELSKNQEQAPETVRFEPWIVGDRDGMLVELMSDLASAVEAIEAPEKGQREKFKEETGRLAEQLRGYASKLSRGAAPIAQFAGILGLPGGELAGKALDILYKMRILARPRLAGRARRFENGAGHRTRTGKVETTGRTQVACVCHFRQPRTEDGGDHA